jgi:hypothetical protein
MITNMRPNNFLNYNFLNYNFLDLTFVKFDTQDNVLQICSEPWKPNLNLDDSSILQEFGLNRVSDTKIWFKSTVPVKTIRLNGFNKHYKIKKISKFHFEITCNKLPEYFDGTDVINVIVRK